MTGELPHLDERLPQPDVAAKVTGAARYVEDLVIPGMLEGRILTSPHAHARIVSIDTARAKALPGVITVITHTDLSSRRFSRSAIAEASPDLAYGGERRDQLVLSDKARHIGDWVAAVAAEDLDTAEEALGLIEVYYEPLPGIFDPVAALDKHAPQVHADAPGNVAFDADHPFNRGDTARAFAEAEAVVSFSAVNSRQKDLHLETDAAVAWFDTNGRLNVASPSQVPELAKAHLQKHVFTDLDDSDVRWVTPPTAGRFGANLTLGVELVAVALARTARRPVRVTTTRDEDFSGGSSRTDQHQTIRIAARRDGTITGIEQNIIADCGAYLSDSAAASMVGMQMTLGLFRSANIHGHVTVAYTNTPTTGGFRGYGNVEGTFVLQQAADVMAEKLGMDPVAFRLTNIPSDGEPRRQGASAPGYSRLEKCIRVGADRFGWAGKWKGWGAARTGRHRRGVGMAIVDGGGRSTATGSSLSPWQRPGPQASFAEIEVDTETGVVSVIRYVCAHGSGRTGHPRLVEMQMEGATVAGLGLALSEDFTIDPFSGRVLSNSLLSYRLPTTMDVPDIEFIPIDDPDSAGPGEAAGDAGMANPAGAIANAIYDAIGIRVQSLPMAADKILYALRHKTERPLARRAQTGASRVSGQFI